MRVKKYRLQELLKQLIKRCKAFFGVGKYSGEDLLQKEIFLYSLAGLSETDFESLCKFSPAGVHRCMQEWQRGGQITIGTPQKLRMLCELAKATLEYQQERIEYPKRWQKRLKDFDKNYQWIIMNVG